LLSFFQLSCLPVASTFWRYVNRLGINQANALVRLMALMRQRAWQLCDLNYYRVSILPVQKQLRLFSDCHAGL